MLPPRNKVQGKPSYKLNSNKHNPRLEVNQPQFSTGLSDKLFRQVDDEDIPSPMKTIGIETNPYEISLACRSVNDFRRVDRGNGLFYNRQLVNATPTSLFSPLVFSPQDRVGTFGMNPKQPPITVHTFG